MPSKRNEQQLEIFIGQEPLSSFLNVHGGSYWSTAHVDHGVGDCEYSTAVDASLAVDQCSPASIPCILDNFVDFIKVLHDVIFVIVVCIEFEVALDLVTIETCTRRAAAALITQECLFSKLTLISCESHLHNNHFILLHEQMNKIK